MGIIEWPDSAPQDARYGLRQSDTPRGAGGLMSWAVSKTASPWV